jgi:hypothetical protein
LGDRWWERRWVAVVLALACALPLLWPALPPLVDLPGHMARWHIAMDLHRSADLQRYYDYHWAVIPNLGMDVLVPTLAMLFGLEFATKLTVIAIPVLTASGLLAMAREAHGRVPPTALFALPLVYAWPFQFGFVNFALSQGLAFCAFALWLRLGRDGRFRLRSMLFVPIAFALWVAHSFGWGMFGLMAAGAEVARLRSDGRNAGQTLVAAGVQGLPLALPIVVMAGGAGGAALGADDWFDWSAKLLWVAGMLRDRWQVFDLLSLLPLVAVLCLGLRSPRLGWSPLLGWAALLCLAAFVLLPRLLMGGAYVDMRMIPAAAMLAIVAVGPPVRNRRFASLLSVLGLAFLVVRLAGTTVSFAERSAAQESELAAIAAMPRGAAVLTLVARPCGDIWGGERYDALPGMAVVRRDAFVNTNWALAGQQLLQVRYAAAGAYRVDPSQQMSGCSGGGPDFTSAIARFPRQAFSYVWTIGFAPGTAKAGDLQMVWSNERSALYRVR